ncbi:phage distal tail protein [Psychrobacillus sp. BM2]|uniref:phage distal tail protein n=1 Tax=Psychrobacillus sp. BM2 TaxID=3400421 RepID=UPI003B01B140
MQLVKYTNALDVAIDFKISSKVILQHIEGTGNVEANHRSSNAPFQNGSKRTKTSLNNRFIKLSGTLKGQSRKELAYLKEVLCGVFNPSLDDGKLEYDAGNGTKFIYAIPEETPIFSEYRGNSVAFIIDLVCHDPYWHDLEDSIHTFTSPYSGLFEFPFSDSFEMGIHNEIVTFVNKGNAETPLFIEFEGGIKNAKLTNKTNGEWIEIKKKLESNERLIINSNVGEKEVRIIKNNGETRNGFGLITLDSSTFMHLAKGENVIEYVAESDSGLAVLHLKWNSRYLGV